MGATKPQPDARMAEIERQKRAAMDARDLETYDLYAAIGRELEQLRVVGSTAAAVYEGGDENAWMALFDALSDAGLL